MNDQQNDPQWTIEEAHQFLGKTDIKHLVAGYHEGDIYTLIIADDSTKKNARRLVYLPTLIFVDSLIQSGEREFKSRKLPDTYFINDSEVVVTHIQKIVHPSSNWQGQTPWKEKNIYTYQRIDRNLK